MFFTSDTDADNDSMRADDSIDSSTARTHAKGFAIPERRSICEFDPKRSKIGQRLEQLGERHAIKALLRHIKAGAVG